jgi:hypothetical protein
MHDTKLWRIIAVVVCVGILYVGHGLHNRGGDGLPSLVNAVHAGGVAASSPKGGDLIYTTDESGTYLHVWTTEIFGKPKYFGTAHVSGPFWEPGKASGNVTSPKPAQKP